MKHTILIATFVLSLAVTASISQAAPVSRMNGQDHRFIMQASQGNMTEVQLGQLAVSKRSGRRVQQFGQQMIQDHSASFNKLQSVAALGDIRLSSDPRRAMGAAGRATYDRLAMLNGSAFSRAYMDVMLHDHETTLALFRREARVGSNPSVRAYAQVSLPILEHHLDMAEPLYAEVTGRPVRMFAHRRM